MAGVQRTVVPKVLPEAQRDDRQLQTTSTTATVTHHSVPVGGRQVGHDVVLDGKANGSLQEVEIFLKTSIATQPQAMSMILVERYRQVDAFLPVCRNDDAKPPFDRDLKIADR
jgi:hypothetical protein